ncbi:MAG: hypothetical protein JXR48_07110 [Candidatus Delongbacteria bacterium]|nr:hypothetical protein [Candidatus Delongbacteria bacterium]MBN2834720.1 hypothetical protein [Candidatus Delongbacteria bacterium]
MKIHSFALLLLFFVFSCSKEIEIDKNEYFFRQELVKEDSILGVNRLCLKVYTSFEDSVNFNCLNEMNKIAKQYKDSIDFYLINIDNYDSLAYSKKIKAYPTYRIYKNYQCVFDTYGFLDSISLKGILFDEKIYR